MGSYRTTNLLAILIGSLDPFGCLSEDGAPPGFDPRPEFCPEEDRRLFFFLI